MRYIPTNYIPIGAICSATKKKRDGDRDDGIGPVLGIVFLAGLIFVLCKAFRLF